MEESVKKQIIIAQISEITEYIIYRKLASIEKDSANKAVLEQIASEENKHYKILQKLSGASPKPNMLKVYWYVFCARTFGLTFAIKLMESGEQGASEKYGMYDIPEIKALAKEEQVHEQRLIALINEERLSYMGSVVLGLNDALVEFTGALAGFTLALGDHKLIALTGSITGIAAALSMASSEYLSTKSEGKESDKHPIKASIYTGVAYLITVIALVSPFVFCSNVIISLVIMLLSALLIIAIFNFYYSVAKGESFKKRFLEMAILSFSVAGVSFLIGYLLKLLTGIEA